MILLGILLALFIGPADLDIPTPDEPEMRASCEAEGGLFVTPRSGAMVCLTPQPDEGQACTTALDCDGYCIGGDVPDHGTCSRYQMTFGCTEFLGDTGEESVICVD